MSRRNPRRGARNARRRGSPAVLLSDDEVGDSSSDDDEQFEEQMGDLQPRFQQLSRQLADARSKVPPLALE